MSIAGNKAGNGGSSFVIKGLLIAASVIFILGAVLIVGLNIVATAAPSTIVTPSRITDEQVRQEVLNYTKCPGGGTLAGAAGGVIAFSGAQQSMGSYAGFLRKDGDVDVNLVAIQYRAANGSVREIRFSYNQQTRVVNADNEDGLAVLRLMSAAC